MNEAVALILLGETGLKHMVYFLLLLCTLSKSIEVASSKEQQVLKSWGILASNSFLKILLSAPLLQCFFHP